MKLKSGGKLVAMLALVQSTLPKRHTRRQKKIATAAKEDRGYWKIGGLPISIRPNRFM
jgi:hypothetical protein